MARTEIEHFVYREEYAYYLVARFQFVDNEVQVDVLRCPDDDHAPKETVRVVFPSAVIESIEEEPEETDTWPVEIMHFVDYPDGDRRRFVLQCGDFEWCWRSDWPTLQTLRP
jgi:hypothetical protein